MEKKDDQIFIGRGKQTNEYYINGSLCMDDIPPQDITTSQKNGKNYLNITIGKRRKPDEWGNTHWISVSRFKPEKKETQRVTLAQANDMPVPF